MANYTPLITMIDLGGLDFIAKNNSTVPGLYSKLNSHISSPNPTIYNFLLAKVQMPPSLVELVALNNTITINGYIVVNQNDAVSFTGWVGPVIQYLNPIENGEYIAPEGVDGYNPVLVNVPDVPAVVQPLSVSENGTYQVPYGVDGYAPVSVNVPPQLQQPSGYGLYYCYCATNGGFYSDPGGQQCLSFYDLQPGSYVFFAGENISTRLRALFFAGKTYSEDFSEYENVQTANIKVYESTQNITGTSDLTGDQLKMRFFVTISSAGVLAVGTSNDGTLNPTYVYKL